MKRVRGEIGSKGEWRRKCDRQKRDGEGGGEIKEVMKADMKRVAVVKNCQGQQDLQKGCVVIECII